MTTLTTPITKEIKYNHGDYDMFLNGEYVGSEASYHSAEEELDRLAFEQLDRAGIEPEMLQSATALDGGSSVEEITAEYAEALPVACDGWTNACTKTATQTLVVTWPLNDGTMFDPETLHLCDEHAAKWRQFQVTPDSAERPAADIPAPQQPRRELSTCERYSTPPSLALWGADTPECPTCGQRHDAILNCPGRTIPVAQCANCDGTHHIQRCPGVWRALTG